MIIETDDGDGTTINTHRPAHGQQEYCVRWEIDIIADTPEDAARIAEADYMKTSGCRMFTCVPYAPTPGALTMQLNESAGATVDLDLEGS